MKVLISILSIFFFLNNSYAQLKKDRDEILEEAYLLYYSEKASWNGTDIFLEKYPEKRDLISGYFSYSENDLHNCIFFDKSEDPYLLAKISFDDSFNIQNTKVDTIQRKLNKLEKDIYTIRQKALNEINHDTIFKTYKNTNLNIIPIISEEEKKVFILTGPQISGVVVFGNDYLITFDDENNIKDKKTLHKNIIPIDYNEKTNDAVTMHSHLESTGDHITSTDVCTLMLYKDHINWKQHIVTSKNNVSLWNCDNNNLLILTKKAWNKIYNNINKKED